MPTNITKPDPIRQYLYQEVPGVDVSLVDDQATFLENIALRYQAPVQRWSFVSGMPPEGVAAGVTELVQRLRTHARLSLGLDRELAEVEKRAREEGRKEYKAEIIEWIEKRRNPIDGDLPTGYADLLDYVRNH